MINGELDEQEVHLLIALGCCSRAPILPEEGKETVRVMEMVVDSLQKKNI